MKTPTIILLLALTVLSTHGQDKISYDIIEDAPEFNGVTIAPFMGVNYSFGQTFSTNVGMELMVRKFPVHFRGYIDQTIISAALFTDGYSGPRIIEGGVSYPFLFSTKNKNKRVNLKVTESSEYVYSTYTTAPVTVDKFTEARAGLFRNKGNYNQDILFKGHSSTDDVTADYKVTGLYFGIAQNRRNNTVLDFKDWGKRRNTSFSQLYADLLIGMFKDFGVFDSPFVGFPGSHSIEKSQVAYSNIGMRVGWLMQLANYAGKRPNGYGAKMEFGARPAPA